MSDLLTQEKNKAGSAPHGARRASAAPPGLAKWILPPPLHPSLKKMLERALSVAAEFMENRLSLKFKVRVQVTPLPPDLLYTEDLEEEKKRSASYILKMNPLEKNVLLSMDKKFFSGVVDRILGGPGSTQKDREEISSLEYALGKRFVTTILNSFLEGFQSILPMEGRVIQNLPENEEEKTFSSWEAILKLPFRVKVGEEEGENQSEERNLWLAFPYSPFLHHLEGMNKDQEKGVHPALAQHVENTPIPLCVNLGKANLTFQELLDLEIGDIIRLETKSSQKFLLMLGNRVQLKGRIGAFRGRYAFRVEEVRHKDP